MRGVALAGVALAACSPAAATSIPDNLVSSIRYEVHGTISTSCGFVQGGGIADILDLADPADDSVRAARVDLGFKLNCNTPVRMSMTSASGGLAFAGAGTSDRDFTTLVRYRATVVLPGLGASLACQSIAMATANGCAGQTRETVPSGDGRIEVSVTPSSDLLLAGTYRDQLTLTVTPLLGDGGS